MSPIVWYYYPGYIIYIIFLQSLTQIFISKNIFQRTTELIRFRKLRNKNPLTILKLNYHKPLILFNVDSISDLNIKFISRIPPMKGDERTSQININYWKNK